MTDARDPRPVQDWELERFRLGELPPPEMARLAGTLTDDPTLRLRLDQLARDDRELLDELPPRAAAAAIRARCRQSTARLGTRLPVWQPVLAVAAAVVAALSLTLLRSPQGPSTADRTRREPTRIKGLRPEVFLFRQTPNGAEPLTRASVARAGDVVQLAYQAAGQRYGAIVSLDSRGVVTRHLPRGGSRAAELAAGGSVPLPAAYELDDAPRWEAFYIVTAPAPFPVDLVVNAAAAARPRPGGEPVRLALPAGLEQSVFLLKKDVAR